MHPFFTQTTWVLRFLLSLDSCTKQELITVSDSDAPLANPIPRIKIENYVILYFQQGLPMSGRSSIPIGKKKEKYIFKILEAEFKKVPIVKSIIKPSYKTKQQ